MNINNQIFVISTILFLCWSCGEGNSPLAGKTVVSFVIPPIEQAPLATDIHSWGATTPSTASDIDCVGIFVRYPENTNNGSCVDSIGNTVVATASSLLGLYNRGSAVSAAITSGSNRIFYLVGFASNGTCPDFSNIGTTQEAYLSEPLVLGSTTTSIAGATQSVSLSGSVSSAQSIGDCTGGPFDWAEGTGLYGNGSAGSISLGSDYTTDAVSAKVHDLSSDGKTITVANSTVAGNFSVGKEIFWHVLGTGSTGTGCDTTGGIRNAGLTGTAIVTANSGSTFTIDSALGGPGSGSLTSMLTAGVATGASNSTPWCKIQVTIMPNYQDVTISGADLISTAISNIESSGTDYGEGVIAFRVNGTLTLGSSATADIDASGKGYQTSTDVAYRPGASPYGIGGSTITTANGSGGGGGGSSTNAGGGGASYASVGEGISGQGDGGNYVSCSSTSYGNCMQFGGEGGCGSATGSGNGGGIIYIYARNVVISGSVTISASGSSASGTNGGGGGGGSINLAFGSLTIPASASLNVNSTGGAPNGSGGTGAGGLIYLYSCSLTGTGTLNTSVFDGDGLTAYDGQAYSYTSTCP